MIFTTIVHIVYLLFLIYIIMSLLGKRLTVCTIPSMHIKSDSLVNDIHYSLQVTSAAHEKN